MDWLTDPENQKTLALIGSGVAAIAAAAWAMFKYFHSSRSNRSNDASLSSQTVTADRGGIAAGRDAHVTRPQADRKKGG
jgi:hypothetical protein